MTRFEEVMAALSARDSLFPSEPEQKNLLQAQFLHGAATAFKLCWRGEESEQCLEAAKALANDLRTAEQAPSADGADRKGRAIVAVRR
jgi:hypothetical protein